MQRSLRLVLWAFYFTNFAALGLFVPYFNLHLADLGFSATRIGLLLALVPLAKATLPGVWGAAADVRGGRRAIMVGASWAATAAFAGFLLVDSFSGCLAVMAVYAVMAVPAVPLVEATTMEHISATGADYGRIRVAGSIGFALTALLYGHFSGSAAADHVTTAMLVALAAGALAIGMVPVAEPAPSGGRASMAGLLRQRPLALLLAAGFLMQASHGAYIGFFSLVLEDAGYRSGTVGLAWAGAIVAEVIMMLLSGSLLAALGARRLMALSVAMAAVRWALYALSVAPAFLVLGQTLHAFTYAGFHVAAVQTIHGLVPAGRRATGQAIYSGWTFGAGMMVGTAASGMLKDAAGRPLMFGVAAALALGALGLIGLGAGRRQPAAQG